jgi:hypothetical protein
MREQARPSHLVDLGTAFVSGDQNTMELKHADIGGVQRDALEPNGLHDRARPSAVHIDADLGAVQGAIG